jgi:cell pole-organizing protein PopZ
LGSGAGGFAVGRAYPSAPGGSLCSGTLAGLTGRAAVRRLRGSFQVARPNQAKHDPHHHYSARHTLSETVLKLTSAPTSCSDTTIMLTRRVCASVRGILSPPSATVVRSQAFSTGALTQSPARAPTLADITPDGAAVFNQKQKSFRDGLIAAQKRKEQEESPSCITQRGRSRSANVINYRRCPRP